jgi:RHS repeat-associated protein
VVVGDSIWTRASSSELPLLRAATKSHKWTQNRTHGHSRGGSGSSSLVAGIDLPVRASLKGVFLKYAYDATAIAMTYCGACSFSVAFRNGYKLTGKERDGESGLDNFGARYSASSLARFMTPDWAEKPTTVPYAKFGDPQSLNLYSFTENGPVNRIDPDGHDGEAPAGGSDDSGGGPSGGQAQNKTPQASQASAMAGAMTLAGAASQTTAGAGSALADIAKIAGDLLGVAADALSVPAMVVLAPTQLNSDENAQMAKIHAAEDSANTNPFTGPVSDKVTVVDAKGNAIPVQPGQQIQGSKDGRWTQVKDANGQPTGTRIDNGHPSHSDPRAQEPHAHVPGVTNPDGTPWLPVKQ